MKVICLLVLICSFALKATGSEKKAPSKLECFKMLQKAQAKLINSGVKRDAIVRPNATKPPTDFLLSNSGQVAFKDADGNIRVTSNNGDWVVSQSCNLDTDNFKKNNFSWSLQKAYEYMSLYPPESWKKAKDYCNNSGVYSAAEAYKRLPEDAKRLTPFSPVQ